MSLRSVWFNSTQGSIFSWRWLILWECWSHDRCSQAHCQLRTPATTAGSTGFSVGWSEDDPGLWWTVIWFNSETRHKPQAGLTFGTSTTGSTFGATTQPGLGFGTTTGTSGFKLGSLGSTTATGSSGFGSLGGSSLGGGLSLGSTTAAAGAVATSASKGLGGVTLTSSSAATSTNSSKSSDSKVLQDSQVPAEICNTVTAFKDYVKRQKSFKDDIASFSDKPLHAVREDTVALKQLLAVLDSTFNRNAAAIHRLKEESSQTLKDAEIAQRTKEIPLGLQGDNYAPSEYFQRLVKEFEDQFQQYRHLIEQLEHQMSAMSQKSSYTPQELSQVMVKLNETFIALAAQLQGVHDLVKVQKEQYLTYRRVFHNESKDVFAARKKAVADQRRIKSAPTGSRAFEGTSNAAALAMLAALNGQPNTTGDPLMCQRSHEHWGWIWWPIGSNSGLSFGGGTTGFGTSALGGNTGTALGGGFGSGFTGSSFGTGTSLFGKPPTTSTSGFNFGGSLSAGPLGTTSTGFGTAAQ
ncbi:putative nucleoporin p58/p45, partial [Apostichopus japonicus]